MPIPFLLIGIGALAATGVGKGIKAAADQSDAKSTNSLAEDIIREEKKEVEKARKLSNKAIQTLGEKKVEILDGSISAFVKSFEKIHNIELEETIGTDEMKKFKLNKKDFVELKEMGSMASSMASGVAGGAVAGALTAFGAYGATMVWGTASTGTAIATLSGVAASNATLAFLGGGSLAAGGLGIAGGTMVLGGLVAAPALAIMGFVVGAKAKANKEEAYANLAKAREYAEELRVTESLCEGIRLRADMFYRLIIKLQVVFEPLVYEVERMIAKCGTDYSEYSQEERELVAETLSMAGAIKAVLDTSILTEDGLPDPQSEKIAKKIQRTLSNKQEKEN